MIKVGAARFAPEVEHVGDVRRRGDPRHGEQLGGEVRYSLARPHKADFDVGVIEGHEALELKGHGGSERDLGNEHKGGQ